MCHFYAIRTRKFGTRVEFVMLISVAEESMISLIYSLSWEAFLKKRFGTYRYPLHILNPASKNM